MAACFGTSSWSEKGWVGSFYPSGTAPRDFLAYYATRFETVEADVTYYRVPDLALVRGWDAKVPAGFNPFDPKRSTLKRRFVKFAGRQMTGKNSPLNDVRRVSVANHPQRF